MCVYLFMTLLHLHLFYCNFRMINALYSTYKYPVKIKITRQTMYSFVCRHYTYRCYMIPIMFAVSLYWFKMINSFFITRKDYESDAIKFWQTIYNGQIVSKKAFQKINIYWFCTVYPTLLFSICIEVTLVIQKLTLHDEILIVASDTKWIDIFILNSNKISLMQYYIMQTVSITSAGIYWIHKIIPRGNKVSAYYMNLYS